jgi:hypothetical protein
MKTKSSLKDSMAAPREKAETDPMKVASRLSAPKATEAGSKTSLRGKNLADKKKGCKLTDSPSPLWRTEAGSKTNLRGKNLADKKKDVN